MIEYEIYWIAKSGQTILQDSRVADNGAVAFKSFLRNHFTTFYHEQWKEDYRSYITVDGAWMVIESHFDYGFKIANLQTVFHTFLKNKKNNKPCDCGGLKCNTTHSFWCSTRIK